MDKDSMKTLDLDPPPVSLLRVWLSHVHRS